MGKLGCMVPEQCVVVHNPLLTTTTTTTRYPQQNLTKGLLTFSPYFRLLSIRSTCKHISFITVKPFVKRLLLKS